MTIYKVPIPIRTRIILAIMSVALYALLMYLYDMTSANVSYGLNLIVLQGLIFGAIFGLGGTYLLNQFGGKLGSWIAGGIKPRVLEDQSFKNEGGANLFREKVAIGGKHFLTDKELIIASRKWNVLRGQTNLELSCVSDVQPRITGLVDNGIRITTTK